jgi:hypothetical protein
VANEVERGSSGVVDGDGGGTGHEVMSFIGGVGSWRGAVGVLGVINGIPKDGDHHPVGTIDFGSVSSRVADNRSVVVSVGGGCTAVSVIRHSDVEGEVSWKRG